MTEANRKAYKKESKDFLIDNIDQLNRELEAAYARIRSLKEPTPKRPWYGSKFGVISLDFWPPSDWFRLRYSPWGVGKYAQLTIGPIRIDWAEG